LNELNIVSPDIGKEESRNNTDAIQQILLSPNTDFPGKTTTKFEITRTRSKGDKKIVLANEASFIGICS